MFGSAFQFLGEVIRPPRPFAAPANEEAFLREYGRRFTRDRRAGLVVTLLLWVAYTCGDIWSGIVAGKLTAAAMLVVAPRILGIVLAGWAAADAFRRDFEDDRYATGLITGTLLGLLALALGMSLLAHDAAKSAGQSVGVLLVVLLMFGFLRMRGRPLLRLLLAAGALVMAAAALAALQPGCLADQSAPSPSQQQRQASAAHDPIQRWVQPCSETPSAAARIEKFKIFIGAGSDWEAMLASSFTDIVVFALLGLLLANDIERSARRNFLREAELVDAVEALGRARSESRIMTDSLIFANKELTQAQREAQDAAEALSAKTNALVAAKEELRLQAEQENRNKSKFLADAAHDLRQPMQALTSLLEVAQHHAASGDLGKCSNSLGLARRAVSQARSSFNAVLDISRLESGFVAAEYSVFDVEEVVAEVVAAQSAAAAEAGVRLRCRTSAAAPAIVRSDRHLLARVLANLVSNGIKYRAAERADAAVIVGVVRLPGRIRIDVVDNGIGIPRDQWQHVFQPFVQLANTHRDREKGLGLGLSIINAIIPLLAQHRIDMRSAVGRGTRFSLELPRALASAATAGAAAAFSPSHAPAEVAGVAVCYVEDDPLVREANVELFEAQRIIVDAFASFRELEAGMARMERKPDIIVSDYRLPEACSAEDVCRLVRAEWGEDVPVIVTTGEVADLRGTAWLEPGKVLRKPIAPERLLAEIGSRCLR